MKEDFWEKKNLKGENQVREKTREQDEGEKSKSKKKRERERRPDEENK